MLNATMLVLTSPSQLAMHTSSTVCSVPVLISTTPCLVETLVQISHMGAYAMGHYYLAAGPVTWTSVPVYYSSSLFKVGDLDGTHTNFMGIKAGLAVNYPINDRDAVGLDVNFLMHGKSSQRLTAMRSTLSQT